MEAESGILLGLSIVIVGLTSAFGSYFLWEKIAGHNHRFKQIFFSLFCFAFGIYLGIVGTLPALALSYFVAKLFRPEQEQIKNKSSKKHLRAVS